MTGQAKERYEWFKKEILAMWLDEPCVSIWQVKVNQSLNQYNARCNLVQSIYLWWWWWWSDLYSKQVMRRTKKNLVLFLTQIHWWFAFQFLLQSGDVEAFNHSQQSESQHNILKYISFNVESFENPLHMWSISKDANWQLSLHLRPLLKCWGTLIGLKYLYRGSQVSQDCQMDSLMMLSFTQIQLEKAAITVRWI